MDVAIIEVSGIQATTTWTRAIPSGIIGARILFRYTDPEWDNLVKNVIIRHGGTTRMIIDATNVVELPKELVEVPSAQPVWVGVYGVSPDGSTAIPTLWAPIGIVRNAADPSRDPTSDSGLPIWAQLLLRIEALEKSKDTEVDLNDFVRSVNGIAPDENGNVVVSGDSGGSDYVLPVGGDELGGVKNGGNVVINIDGTMTAPESTAAPVELDTTLTKEGMAADAKAVGDALKEMGQPTDEQIAGAVSDWIEENPDKMTTVQDGAITQEKLSDALVAKLGLEPNHNLTEVKLTLHNGQYNSWWAGTDTGSSTSTELFETPQYIRVVNNHTCDIHSANVRFADINDFENAVFTEKEQNGWFHQMGYFVDTIPAGEELTIPTFEWGANSRKYMQISYQPSDWNGAWNNIEIYAIYDTWRPTYDIPNDAQSREIFLEDLPMKWVVTSDNGASQSGVYCAVPYYPDFTYHIRGGYYATVAKKTMAVYGIFDDISVFDTVQPCIVGQSGHVSNINAYSFGRRYGGTKQYDESVNGGANPDYQWAYFKTPPEEEHTGLKWLLIQFNLGKTSDGGYVTGSNLTKEIADYMLEQWLSRDVGYQYISRWENKDMPRKPTTQLRILNPNLNDGGTIYQAFNTLNIHSPLAGSRWVLFGDSLTDNYGGHDKSSNYFAAKIANEFNMNFDNRAKSGSNIYAGGSGNYTAVSGIVMLDAYLAEIEAGTTEQADYITVAFGTNTFKDQLGTHDDTSATNTSVYGATKYFIEKIREKVPNAVMGFVLSPRQDWGSFDAQGARDLNGAREAIKTVCDDYGVPYIDMSTQSGITVDMLPDGIHISNDQSQKLYYHAMRRFMMGL